MSASAILEDEISHSAGEIGGQLAVFLDGELVETASTGTSGPLALMAADTLHNIWCGAKVISQTAAMHWMWSNGIADNSLEDLLPPHVSEAVPSDVARLTARDLLSHRIPLPNPHVMAIMRTAPSDRLDVLLRGLGSAARVPAAGTYAPTRLLQIALEFVSGRAAEDIVRDFCRQRLVFADEIVWSIEPDDLERVCGRIGPYALTHYGRPVHSYHDRVPTVACFDRFACGGFVSMRALAEFYSLFGRDEVIEHEFVDWVLAGRPAAVFDSGIGTEVEHVSGFHAQIAGYRPLTRILGYPGLTGASYGFAMPDKGLAAAFMVNEFFQNTADIDFFRHRMLRAIERSYAAT